MRNRAVLPAAALAAGLLLAACSTTTSHSDKPSAAPSTTVPSAPATTPVPTTAAATTSPPTTAAPKRAKAKPKPKPTEKTCGPQRDVLVWTKVDGVPAMAEVLGNYNLATCQTTFDMVRTTSPTEAGACTEAAWASDNPGYNTDAEPAARPKKVQVAIGPAC